MRALFAPSEVRSPMRPRAPQPTTARLALVAALVLASASAEAKSQIMFLHTPPASAVAGEALVISGNVFNVAELERAVLFYRVGVGLWKQLEMEREGSDTYAATLPAADLSNDVVSYFVEATDYFGDKSRIFASKEKPQQVPLAGGTSDTRASEPAPEPKPEPVAERAVSPGVVPPVNTRLPEVEQWDPDLEVPATGPDAPRTYRPPASKPARSALADDLMMFAADDTVSLASRHQQTVSDAPAIVSVVTSEQMRAFQLRTLADLLKRLPGFETSRDVQGFWRVAARGRRSEGELLVLYDGHRLNNPYDGRVDYELPLENVERVEVIRGPGSALYGAGAFSGVVNLIPRRDTGLASAVSTGSFGAFDAKLRGGRNIGDFRLFGEIDAGRRSGYVKNIATDAASTDPDRRAGVTDDSRAAFGAALHAELPVGETTLAGSLRLRHQERGALVGLVDVVGAGSELGWTQFLGDVIATTPAASGTLRARAYLDQHATDRLFVIYPPGYRLGATAFPEGVKQQTKASLLSLGLEASFARDLFKGNAFTAGLQLERQALSGFEILANVESEEPTQGGRMNPVRPSGGALPQHNPELSSRVVFGLFLQDEWRLADPLQVTAGLRTDFVSGYGFTLNPRLAIVLKAADELVFKLLFSRAFRAPTFEEALTLPVLSPTFNAAQFVGYDAANPLQPATVTTAELGAETARAVGEGRASLRANAFWNGFSSPIDQVDVTGLPHLVNREKGVRVLGAEAEGRYEWARRGGATFVNVSWLRARDLDADALTPDFALLTDVPQLRANWGLVLPLGPATLALDAQFGAERRNNARSTLEATRRFRIPAYGLLGVTLRTRPIFERYEAALSVFNLTDLSYFDDVPRPDERRLPGLLPREGVNGALTVRASF